MPVCKRHYEITFRQNLTQDFPQNISLPRHSIVLMQPCQLAEKRELSRVNIWACKNRGNFTVKLKRFSKVAWIWSLHLQWKFKSLLTSPSNVLPLHIKQTFTPIIWIFNDSEGDGIKCRLPFKICSSLTEARAKATTTDGSL